MIERRFLTGFVLPMTAAFALLAASGSKGAVDRQTNPRDRRAKSYSGGSPHDPGRGRQAQKPEQIPKLGWRDILLRVKDQVSEDHISVLAAGIAFYGLLAIFPALAAAVSIYGMAFDPHMVEAQLAAAAGILPEESRKIITDQLAAIASQPRGNLGIGALIALGIALWSSSSAVQNMMIGLNVVYDETEKRSFVRFYGTALILTVGGILATIIGLSLVAALPAALQFIGLPPSVETTLSLLRWPLLAVATMVALAVLYRYGPSREEPQWRWVSWGAVAATVLWLVGSGVFSFYVSHFASYNKTYGALGAVVILLMWFYLTAYSILLGAELNSEMEHQTARDTTERKGAPLGERGAYVADTVGAVP